MPPTTPDNQDFLDEHEHVSLGLGSTSTLRRDLSSYSATDDVDGVLIYTHACSMRVSFNIDTPAVLKVLARCGWSSDARTWKLSKPGGGASRYVLRGSKWFDERPPNNRKLPFVRRNTEWKTRIYSLAIETKGDEVHVDLQVVRHGDVARFFETVLGLKSTDYEITYYRNIERYMVLPPHEAVKLAERLGVTPVNGRGRKARIRYLVKDFEVPITVRQRAKATAKLVVYRIDRGATAAYRVEARLRGQRHDRGEFYQADIAKLDAVLLDLVSKCDLKTIAKPVRWEPRTFTTALEGSAFDPSIKRLPQRAWRGSQIPKQIKRIVEMCHTPDLVKWVSSARNDAVPASPRLIRSNISTSSSSSSSSSRRRRGRKSEWKRVEGEGFEITQYILKESNHETQGSPTTSTTTPRGPWNRIVHDIHQSRLYLHEVILDSEQSPRELLEALTGGTLGRVGVAALCAVDASGTPDLYGSVREAMEDHPFDGDDLETLVLVIDASATLAVAGAVVGMVEPEVNNQGEIVNLDNIFINGPLMPLEGLPGMDAFPAMFRAMGAWLDDLFAQLRQLGEQAGLRVIAVTVDARPDHGRGALLRTHYFRDGRVRSSIGDAGRRLTHQRYLVERVVESTSTAGYTANTQDEGEATTHVYEPRIEYEATVGNVIVIKDEAEGQTGRLI